MPSVSLQNMQKKYGEVVAVDHINLQIDDGEMVVLLGPSGCGKTTTLRCIAGLEQISDGEIRIGERLVSSKTQSIPTEKREIGMVFQSYAIWPHMSVEQNIAFGLKAKGVASADVKSRVRTALGLVGLESFAERGASALSGGQQQRVALARAIVLEPQILLFDEPLSNLDAKLRDRMRFEIRDLQQRLGITSVYVTHDQDEAMALADRIVLMDKGVIAQIGSPADLYNAPASLFVAQFVGSTNVLPAELADGKIRIAGKLTLDVANATLAAGTALDALVRPERIRLSHEQAPGPNALKATVLKSMFFGDFTEYDIDVEGVRLRCKMSPPLALDKGQTVWARIAPEDVILLPRPTS